MIVNHDISSDALSAETFTVHGMSCSGCAMRVEKALVLQKGVKSASVDIDNASVQVEFDTAITSPEQLQRAVKTIGYDFLLNG